MNGREFDGKAYARKEQNDFGWDWSPRIAPAGPWRPAHFVQKSSKDPVVLENTLIDIYRQGQMNNLSPDQSAPWVFNASIDYLGSLPGDAKLHLTLKDSSGKVIEDTDLGAVTSNNMTITGSVVIEQPVELWWPNGMGSQPLYKATVSISSGSWNKPAKTTKRVGFRTIVLNLSTVTQAQEARGIAPGSNWHFEINGQEMYAKGANLVPMDVFWPRVNSTKVNELFDLVVNANQNMLRVWASGVYLSDEIYDLADEKGILLWSEFQFTDAEYAITEDFLANYEAEAYYNVRRINRHPSLALWAGGNELEAIILAYFNYPGEVRDGYEKLFLEVLVKCVYANTKSISYIPSSTYHGYTKLDFDSVRPQTPRYDQTAGSTYLYANTDAYNGDAGQAFNYSARTVGRFATEFGSISLPSIHSWRDAAPESDLSVNGATVLHHNRHYLFGASGTPADSLAGLSEATNGVVRWYPKPSISNAAANFSAWCWSTQVYQADKYAAEIAFYRRGSAHRERQLGSLFWQLNDLWVAPTWAAIESSGRTKVMYHATKDIYSPVIVWPFYDQHSDALEIWVISDRGEAVSGTVDLKWVDWYGKNVDFPDLIAASQGKARMSIPFNVQALNGTKVFQYTNISSLFPSSTDIAKTLLSLVATSNGKDLHSSWLSIAPLAKVTIPDPGLILNLPQSFAGHLVQFQVTAQKAVASKVWLDHPSTVGGFFDHNGFWLDKGETKNVTFTVWDDFTQDAGWVKSVTVRSIWDNTQNAAGPFL